MSGFVLHRLWIYLIRRFVLSDTSAGTVWRCAPCWFQPEQDQSVVIREWVLVSFMVA
jgi:hypothetical protein